MGSLDLEARLAAIKLGSAPAAAPAEASKPAEDRGPLGGPWLEGTKLGPAGSSAEEIGRWLKENWEGVSAAPPEECGLLAGAGCEAAGGPPDRLTQVSELEVATKGELDCPRASALHCAFGMLFWAHQQAIAFKPNLSMGAAGQKDKSGDETVFEQMIKVCSLSQQICRDIRNLAYSRYGREKCGLKNASQFARASAEEMRKHSAALKEFINATMADSIGLSTGGS
mmetsp:Transcript_48800/g.145807  ORF Transcript_48800/g.145807 Transcript_48800/m.145807 type:complete len:226 (+) Transcript_48800:81-758(+)